MIFKKFNCLLVLTISLLFIIQAITIAEGNDNGKNKQKLQKVQQQVPFQFLDINQILTVFRNNGISDWDKDLNNSGFVYPKGSGKTAVFTSGLLWGARVVGDPQVRVGGTAYATGVQPGIILPDGTADDPTLEIYRIYRVRPDIYPGGPDVDLSAEAILEFTTAAAIKAQYDLDWNEWPATLGAPYNDVDGNGVYDPAVDIPGVPGADQTLWFVGNDMNGTFTADLYGAAPMGLEIQGTFWAYNQSGALGHMYFRKYRLINKGSQQNTLDSMYVSMWSDVDLGGAGDDFVGVDTTLSLQFTYNATATDEVYTPLPPPATGFDFFQGPLVTGVAGEDRNKNGIDDAVDFGIFDGKVVGPGLINLPMTAAYYFANGDPNIGDPPQGNIQGSTEFYNFFRGRFGKTGQFFTNLVTGQPTTFALSGDPQLRTGWLDGIQLPPGDRRQGSASGPFTLAPGDTQEVVVAEMVAGAIPGVDRLSAIGLLKFYDQIAQVAYDNFFDLPVPPPAPIVNVVELDKRITLDWSIDLLAIQNTETSDSKGYLFQGYNIYQLPTATASVSEGVRLATYDLDDGIGKIEDFVFDPGTGSVIKVPVQFGNDTGIRRFLTVSLDQVKGGVPLVNGIKYYYAVTAYSFNPDINAVPNNLENPIKILTVIPHSTAPGETLEYTSGDTLKVEHMGSSDGTVSPIVVDPRLLTGDDYKVSFDTLNGEMFWNLTDVTTGQVKLSNQTNFNGDIANYSAIDGMIVVVSGPPNGMRDWDVPEGTRRFTWGNASGFGWEGFNGAIGWGSPFGVFGGGTEPVAASEVVDVLLKLASVPEDPPVNFEPTFDPNDENVSYGYRYGRSFASPMARPEFDPYFVNPSLTGYDYQDFTKSVPLSAWDVSDPDNPRRLAVGFLENNQEGDLSLPVNEAGGGLVDGKWWPGDYNAFNNTAGGGPREWLWIFLADYSETPNPDFQVEPISNPVPVMWWVTVNRRGNVPFSPGGTGEDQFLIISNKVISVDESFNFTAPAPGQDNNLARSQVDKINVFPNPYYGVNSEEINKYNRFVTFSHLPDNATIRIFNLAGVLVKKIKKDPLGGQFQRWDLANQSGLPVASGLYIAYIELPDLGTTKILKIAIIQEQQILDRF